MKRVRGTEYRSAPWAALASVLCAATAAGAQIPGPAGPTAAPAIHFHVGAEELASSVGPVSPRDSVWVAERAADLVEWWEEDGPTFLSRASSYAGLAWPYADIEVYLVRDWPPLSIEYPLVLALGTFGTGGEAEVPDDADLHVLLVAHQLTHYLLDDPAFVPRSRRPRAYDHPFLAPGELEVEAMVNWLVYAVMEEMWGRSRLERATGMELWRTLAPNHPYVTDELRPRWRLGAQSTLATWLAQNPRGSEIFRVKDAYARQLAAPEETPPVGGAISGTEYGLDLGASFQGAVFVAFVDAGSPADRAGLRQGDVLVTIEGRPVGTDVVDARRRIDASWQGNGEINLSIQRSGREMYFTVERR